MLESTPGSPYSGSISDLLSVECNMRYRLACLYQKWKRPSNQSSDKAHACPQSPQTKWNTHDIYFISSPRRTRSIHRAFFRSERCGLQSQLIPSRGDHKPSCSIPVGSPCFRDTAVAEIILCRTLTANIRTRRRSKVAINLPIFIDEKVPRPFVDPTIPWDRSIYKEDSG